MVFLIENLSETFKNEEVPDGDLLNLQCFIGNIATPVKIFDVIKQNIVTKSQFCPNNTETTTRAKPKETTIATKKSQSSTKSTSVTKEFTKNTTKPSLTKSTISMSHNSQTRIKASVTQSLTTLMTSDKKHK
jgi:hypothetical protein